MTDISKPTSGGTLPDTIMLIDPDILVRTSIADYLRGCGYIVIEGSTPDDAWTVLGVGTKVHIILVDIDLVGSSDGFELAKQIRTQYPQIDTILAAGTAKVAQRAGDLCDERPLGKPYHPDELIKRIHLLRERRRTSNLRKI